MIRTLFCFLLIFSTGVAGAQEICKRTSVFFETGKHEITPEARHKLDSLAASTGKMEFLVELYGHTDTVGSLAYNEQLAIQRMKSVKEYLLSKTKAKLQFKEKNLTETNNRISSSSEKNLAFNRCVDVFLIPVSDGRIVLTGPGGETVETPLDYFEPCGVCNSAPIIKSYYSAEEAAQANILLQTEGGQPLITGGMIDFQILPCGTKNENSKKDSACIIYTICRRGNPPCPMEMYEGVQQEGKTVWKLTQNGVRYDTITHCLSGCHKGLFMNFDCPEIKRSGDSNPRAYLLKPSALSYHRMFIIEPLSKTVYKTEKDSLSIPVNDKLLLAYALGKSGKDYFTLEMTIDSMPSHFDSLNDIFYFSPLLTKYTKLNYSDTLLRVKMKKNMEFGFYLEEFKQFIPLESPNGKYLIGNKPAFKFQYACRSGKKLYLLNDASMNEKYKRKKNTVRIKVRKNVIKKGKKVKEFYVAP
ncbi:hypothetical protein BH11BAC7_BH11BAC7_09630 [soil metagenome]